MTRKTYYLASDTVAALEAAVEEVQAALGGRLDRHEVIGAIITMGTAQIEQVIIELREDLLRDLQKGIGD